MTGYLFRFTKEILLIYLQDLVNNLGMIRFHEVMFIVFGVVYETIAV